MERRRLDLPRQGDGEAEPERAQALPIAQHYLRRFDLYQNQIGARPLLIQEEINMREARPLGERVGQRRGRPRHEAERERDTLYIEIVDENGADLSSFDRLDFDLEEGLDEEEDDGSESSDFSDEERDQEMARKFGPWHCPH